MADAQGGIGRRQCKGDKEKAEPQIDFGPGILSIEARHFFFFSFFFSSCPSCNTGALDRASKGLTKESQVIQRHSDKRDGGGTVREKKNPPTLFEASRADEWADDIILIVVTRTGRVKVLQVTENQNDDGCILKIVGGGEHVRRRVMARASLLVTCVHASNNRCLLMHPTLY